MPATYTKTGTLERATEETLRSHHAEALNLDTDPNRLTVLTTHSSPAVSWAALSNPKTPPEAVLQQLRVKEGLASEIDSWFDCPNHLLVLLAKHYSATLSADASAAKMLTLMFRNTSDTALIETVYDSIKENRIAPSSCSTGSPASLSVRQP